MDTPKDHVRPTAVTTHTEFTIHTSTTTLKHSIHCTGTVNEWPGSLVVNQDSEMRSTRTKEDTATVVESDRRQEMVVYV